MSWTREKRVGSYTFPFVLTPCCVSYTHLRIEPRQYVSCSSHLQRLETNMIVFQKLAWQMGGPQNKNTISLSLVYRGLYSCWLNGRRPERAYVFCPFVRVASKRGDRQKAKGALAMLPLRYIRRQNLSDSYPISEFGSVDIGFLGVCQPGAASNLNVLLRSYAS